jgi:hypothetical protein
LVSLNRRLIEWSSEEEKVEGRWNKGYNNRVQVQGTYLIIADAISTMNLFEAFGVVMIFFVEDSATL